jgi:hypothetical protein
VQEERMRREEGEKKKKKGNEMGNFPNLKISGEKNKRQFTELV